MPDARIILPVVAPHSGSGKTSFVLHVLRHIGGLGCLKISPAHEWPDDVVARAAVTGEDYYLEDPASPTRPGKDTALYVQAGALGVKRLRHRGDGLASGLEAALECYPPALPVVVESSSAVALLKPVAVVLIVRPPLGEMKPTTEAILSRVTDLLINASDCEGAATAAADRLRHRFPALRPRFTWSIDLLAEPLPAELLARLQALLTPPSRRRFRRS